MRAVPFQAPGVVDGEDRPEPEVLDAGDAIVRVEATGVCGSDLHIYHGRVQVEAGFTIGHEYVGTVLAAGEGVTRVAPGDRVLGCFQTACGHCWFCRRGLFHRCVSSRTFGHGATLGSLQGTQAEMALIPNADLVLRKGPEGVSVGAVGAPRALEMAIRLTRACGSVQCIGVYAERTEVHMGLLWLKAITLRGGQANVLAHVDPVLAMLAAGRVDPSPLVTRHMALEDAAEAYAVFDRREALKIILTP